MRGSTRRRRRVRARRLLGVGIVGLVALPVGLAQMSANSIPQSFAGQAQVPVEVATTLVAADPDGLGRLSADLQAGGRALADLPVDFAIAATGEAVCDDVPTGADGVAVCHPAAASGPEAGESVTYVVTFSGLGGLAAASDTVMVVGGPAPDAGAVEPSPPAGLPTPPADPPVDGPAPSPSAPAGDTDATDEGDETDPDPAAPPDGDEAPDMEEVP